MARNVEIKARVADLAQLERRVQDIADQGPFDLVQDDTFFACRHGRLKLREMAPDHGELIYYQRPDRAGPKLSDYTIAPTSSPAATREVLTSALGIVGRVRKKRRLYLVGQVRVHLDEVQSLGQFLELEVVLTESQSTADGEAIAHTLLKHLEITENDLIEFAYLDLLPPTLPQNQLSNLHS